MNKIRLPLLASLVLVLSACGGKAPGDTITDMHAELCRTGDPATMSNYVSKKSQPAMAMITAMMAEPEKAKQIKEKIQEDCKTAKPIEILETTIDGERATVRYTNPEGNETTDTLILEDGEWKLDFNINK